MGNFKKDNMTEFIKTPVKLGEFMVEKSKEYFNNIEEIIDVCAGDGALTDVIERYYDIPVLKYDIEPRREDIIEMDFTKGWKKIGYKKNRLIIINPPFNKTLKFIYKSLEISDYVVSLGGSNSLVNFKWDEYDVLESFLIKKQYFNDDITMDISMFVIKNK